MGQACTDAFVASFISILALDFALAVMFKSIYLTFWPLKSLGLIGSDGLVADVRLDFGSAYLGRMDESSMADQTGEDRRPPKTVIEVRNLTKRFGSKLVLDNVSLAIEKGKTTVIIGPSGCGKTVLMKHFIALAATFGRRGLLPGPAHRSSQ